MRGPFWNNGKTGVTGEPTFRSTTPNLHTYRDEQGNLRTQVLKVEAPLPFEEGVPISEQVDTDQN